jgi:beta-glucosidase/6-phospho-beta-glucosidase/beta-galactosidase
MHTDLFRTFFLGGFECSTHRLRSGKRLDLTRSTRHDELALSDYRLLMEHGMLAARDGFRWTVIEGRPGNYDFSGAIAMLRAAQTAGIQVIWDLWHYGWPDDLDIFSPAFVRGFAAFAKEAITHISEFTDVPYVSPINEISFFSWAGGEAGIFNPFAKHRGHELKKQLVRATVEAIETMRSINPKVRIFQVDPLINIVPRSNSEAEVTAAARYSQSQFAAWDMIAGRLEPELGGRDDLLDVVGVNYYIHNQFILEGPMIVPSDPRYRHVAAMLLDVYERYRRPLFVGETGIEDDARPAWLRYMCKEVYTALAAGVPVEGVCLYPIMNHPGWEDDRHCYNGMFDYADENGRREVYEPLARELTRQIANVAALEVRGATVPEMADLETSALDWAAHVMQERTEQSRS